jgi:hypothetical protein
MDSMARLNRIGKSSGVCCCDPLAFTVGVYCCGCMKLFHELFDTVSEVSFNTSSGILHWYLPGLYLLHATGPLQFFLVNYNHMYRLCHDRSAETLRHCEILLHVLVSVVICEHNKGSALGKTVNYSYIDL